MSYLVDALKKAERERHQQPVADMQSLSDGEPAARHGSGSSTIRWIVIALVACNLALLVYLLGGNFEAPAVDDSATAQTQVAAQESVSASTPATSSPVAKSRIAPAPREPAGMDKRTAHTEPEVSQPLSGLRLSGDPNAPAAGSRTAGRGRVTYAREPLDGTRSQPVGAAQGGPASAPQVNINGHLYSSVPGRSFILVNGRRYHEGERLAAGPAVESIDVSGATLNYRGHRYHVTGPG